MSVLVDVLGWAGAVAVIIAYLFNSAGKLQSDSVYYQLLNLAGALFLIVNTIFKQAYPSAFVNIIWAGIAFYALIKHWTSAKVKRKSG